MIPIPPHKVLRIVASLAAIGLISQSAKAVDSTWTGATSSVWATTTNWTPNAVPSSTISAIFSTAFVNPPTLGATSTAEGIWVTGATQTTGASGLVTIGGAQTLNITGNATLNGISNVGILLDGAGNNSLTLSNNQIGNGINTSFIVNNSGTLTIGNGTSTLNGASQITFGGTSTTGLVVINSRIISTGRSVVIDTAGTVTFNGGSTPNIYNLGLTLNNGNLNYNSTTTSGTGGPFTINGGVLNNTSGTAITAATVNTININGNLNYAGGGTGTSNDINLGVGAVTLNGTGTRTITTTAANSTLTLGGVIANGTTSGLTKAGAGRLALTNVNTYTGPTTINAGTLVLSGSGSVGTGNVVMGGGKLDISAITASGYSLSSSQTLSGNGTLTDSGKTLTLNGVVDPNTTGLTVDGGTVAFASTTSFLYTLGTSSDSISLINSGTLSLGAGLVDFTDFTFNTGAGYGVGTYVLINGASSVTGSLGGTLTGTVGGLNASLALSGNNLVLNVTSVPEPSTWALLGVAGVVGMIIRRRRIA